MEDILEVEKSIASQTEILSKFLGEMEEALSKIAKRKDVNPKSGQKKYGNVEYADPTNKKYPIDTPGRIRAAWNYIHKKHNAGEYSSSNVSSIKAKIEAAWKKKIDPAGPPSAAKGSVMDSCPYCDAEIDYEKPSRAHINYHMNDLSNGLARAKKKIQDVNDSNLSGGFSQEGLMMAIESIQKELDDAQEHADACMG